MSANVWKSAVQGMLNMAGYRTITLGGVARASRGPHEVDGGYLKGDFADTSLESVKDLFAPDDSVCWHQGLFPGTAEAVKDRRFCFVYVDADIHRSVRASLEFFYPRLVAGGWLMLDDYESADTPGVTRAVTEFQDGKRERPIMTARGQTAR